MPIPPLFPAPPAANDALPWQRRAINRLTTLWPLKACGTAAFMPLFFLGYFGVLHYPLFPATVMPLTAVDAWVPFTPAAFGFYAALWVYVSVPPAFLPDRRQLVGYGLWMAALCLSGLAIFWLWPTAVPRADIDWNAYPGIALVKGIDLAGNACPSLHVATAVFSAVWLGHLLAGIGAPRALAAVSWALCAAIIWSTLATRQHVFLDVLGGLAFGLLFAALSLRSLSRPRAAAV